MPGGHPAGGATERTREIEGITAVVVRDTVHVGGVLVEDTYDWLAQDRVGNVWYLGEDSSDFDEEGTSPLEPEVIENKWYAPGIGLIHSAHETGASETSTLVEFTPGR